MRKDKHIVALGFNDDQSFVVINHNDNFVFAVPGRGIHVTVLYRDGRLTAHSTDEHTGEHCHWLTFDLARAAKKAEQTGFENQARKRLLQVFRPVQNPGQLRAQGVGFLLPDPRPRLEPPLDNTRMMDFSELNLTGLGAAWEAAPGAIYLAFGKGGAKGLVLTGCQKGQQVVYFVDGHLAWKFISWLIRELASPTDQIPWDMIPTLP